MKCVYEWFARFREEPESVSDNPKRKISDLLIKSCIKMMFITLFDSQGIDHKEFLPDGMAMNAASNGRPHTANIIKQFRTKSVSYKLNIHHTCQISYTQSIRLLIPTVLTRFERTDVLRYFRHPTNVTRLLNSFPEEDF
ncbi:hypothetical protein TNCV_495931 [Trichonephila clavipes]|nr:hypothetical protein TNCV_495931 [Trichonephila clavipes]